MGGHNSRETKTMEILVVGPGFFSACLIIIFLFGFAIDSDFLSYSKNNSKSNC